MKKISRLSPLVIGLITGSVLSAQGILERDLVPLKNWDAPMYWQPSVVESKDVAAKQLLAGNSDTDRASSITPQAQTPANSLVFVGMTPCRVVDTRTGSGFTGAFGPPSVFGDRTFPIQLSTNCSIPSIAQAYSFNITAVPPGFLDFITVWPTGQARPNASTLNGYVGTVIANAAIVPAGTSGSVDVYASQNTNLIIDINGYYAPQSGITLSPGAVGAPSLSFAGDPTTGIFSSGAGTLDLATGGTSRLRILPNGNVDLTGDVNTTGRISANIVNAQTQYNLGGDRAFITPGTSNTFVGRDAGQSNTPGQLNAIFGAAAGFSNSGEANAFFGASAGHLNASGRFNSYFGYQAGYGQGTHSEYNSFFGARAGALNTTGGANAFFGMASGYSNQTGSFNSFFGGSGSSTGGTGFGNTTGTFNSFFGHRAGEANSTGNSNSFFGTGAGLNSTGSSNTFVGHDAGLANTSGSFNSIVGDGANVAAGNLTNATAVGSKALVSQNNSLVLGSIAGVNGATVNTNVGIGTTAPIERLDVNGTGIVRARINSDSSAGMSLSLGGQYNWSVATVAPGHFRIFNDFLFQNALSISLNTSDITVDHSLLVNGIIHVPNLGNAGATSLCRNASFQISTCSSSIRYKSDVRSFTPGLSLISRLRPVSFTWKKGGMRDMGLIAEEVAEVEPLLVLHNEEGAVEGVKYEKLNLLLINAIKEQQEQIEGLKQLVCLDHPQAAVCK